MAERALNEILTDINTQIKTVSFGGKITTRGLCYLQEKDGKTFPLENTDTRNAKKITWDDNFPLQTYHRILGTTTESDPAGGFGNRSSRTKVYEMRLVGIGSKTALSVAPYEDNQEIAKSIEDVLPPFINTNESLEVSSLEVIKQNVYDSEWAGVEIKKLSLEGIAFWIDYTIKIINCGSTSNFDPCSSVGLQVVWNAKNNTQKNTFVDANDTEILTFIDEGGLNWDQLIALLGRGYNIPMVAQTTVYRTGDAANIEATIFAPIRVANSLKVKNSLVTFYTLGNTNFFGNTIRFTDSVGGQIFGAGNGSLVDYYIDNYTSLAYSGIVTSSGVFDAVIDEGLAATTNGFSNWFVASLNQMESIMDRSTSIIGNAVFTFGTTTRKTSTTTEGSTTYSQQMENRNGTGRILKSTAQTAVLCRKHF